ncbi:DUF2339 domain-containing protein [Sulfurimonas sp. MAG313]|nr:DUF2339 domain-containing protein [Sulfurimonas sp. MAG313]MDF1879744.1 DUF2339 domain-containing protein [Sulfurimonas sp. MAG313]
MWIFFVIITCMIFLSMFFNRAEEESIFVLAILVLAGLIRMTNLTSKLRSELTSLQLQYKILEEKIHTAAKVESSLSSIPKKEVLQDLTIADEKETQSKATLSYFELKKAKQLESTSINQTEALVIEKDISSVNKEEPSIQDTPLNKAINFVLTYMKKGNPLVKVGGALLFFGLSFLIKFAAENDIVSIEMGIVSSIAFSLVLIALGWKHRLREGSYGLILQGLGISIFYLSIFSSAKYFEIIPFSLALGIMIVVVIFASFLAVAQNSLSLALFATTGGFLSPILTSTGEGSHIMLFSYYALLNIGIISIAWFKSWRVLNLTGFAFTFIISLLWGAQRYAPEHFSTTEPFLIFFFLLYVAVSVIFAFKTKYKLKAYVDSSLLFGVPVTAFAMQAALVKEMPYVLSFSSLAVATFYLSLTWWLKKKEEMSVLAESFLALGVVFVTLSIPFSLSGHWTAVTWTLEATAIIWISLRQERFYARIFAVSLQVIAGLVFLEATLWSTSDTLILNNMFLGGLIISIAAFSTSFILEKHSSILHKKEVYVSFVFLLIGLAWWLYTGVKEVLIHLEYEHTSILIFISASALGFFFLSQRTSFKALEKILFWFFPLGLVVLFYSLRLFITHHPFTQMGYISLSLFFAVHYFLLYKNDWGKKHYWHEISLWVVLLILASELSYQIGQFSTALAFASYPIVFVLSIFIFSQPRDFWPLNSAHSKYHNLGLSGVFVALVILNLVLFTKSGLIKGFVYIPFLNPLDLIQVSSLLALVYWMRTLKEGILAQKKSLIIFIATALILTLSVFLARGVHFYLETPYTLRSMLGNEIFQAGISILYSVLALILIVLSKKRASREIWIAGAFLLGFVTLKLFFVELSHSGSLSRIISFMAVGILILLIGYLAPLPPKKDLAS